MAYYEFNASPGGGTGFLIDTSFKMKPKKITAPFLYFRLTDIATTKTGKIYGINYFWSGDYNYYLNNKIVHNPEYKIKQTIPDLRDSLNIKPGYLKAPNITYARIVSLG